LRSTASAGKKEEGRNFAIFTHIVQRNTKSTCSSSTLSGSKVDKP